MHCGQSRHTKQNSPDDRKKYCKAYNSTCNKCSKHGHFSSVCQQKQKHSSTPKAEIQQVTSESPPVAEVSNMATLFALTADKLEKTSWG